MVSRLYNPYVPGGGGLLFSNTYFVHTKYVCVYIYIPANIHKYYFLVLIFFEFNQYLVFHTPAHIHL
jgi:hypothetical protein